MSAANPESVLNFFTTLSKLKRFDSITIGFLEVTKVDDNTFTFKSVDVDAFNSTISNSGLVDEISLKESQTVS